MPGKPMDSSDENKGDYTFRLLTLTQGEWGEGSVGEGDGGDEDDSEG